MTHAVCIIPNCGKRAGAAEPFCTEHREKPTMRGLLTEARLYVSDALEAHEHGDGRDLLTRIDMALGASTASPADRLALPRDADKSLPTQGLSPLERERIAMKRELAEALREIILYSRCADDGNYPGIHRLAITALAKAEALSVANGNGSSLAESGSTASPKSDSAEGH